MEYGGSVPEPLLPPQIALQNPHLVQGHAFYVFPDLAKILVMIDQDGDENYHPIVVPMSGGFPRQPSVIVFKVHVFFLVTVIPIAIWFTLMLNHAQSRIISHIKAI
jgi:hypothetical protein